jgi:DNA repair protein RadB
MQQIRLSSGADPIDALIAGGFENDVLTTIYGPAGSGKSNIALIAVASVLKQGKKVMYVDTEGSFSVDRMLQIFPEFEASSQNLLFLKPTTFDEQKESFEIIHKTINIDREVFDLVVIDSIAMLYRLEIGKGQDVFSVNKELGRQLGLLTEVARKRKIPVVITNQVYADFEKQDDTAVKMVGGDLLKYSSKCLIELKAGINGVREAILRKHRSIPEGKSAVFKIVNEGLIDAEL